ncbi:response regulator transcription factor [Sphingobium aquiterrae]|uniref:response regulator transcription factor n=1 Tax=Sphingobium aquiterrae TaxID=2038656 RepID=UPI0030193121
MQFLVVEDDPVIARHIASGLRALDYDAFWVECGSAAVSAFESDSYDAIVLDRMLPDISGMDLLRTLRQREHFPPVLMLSALGTVQDRIEGLEAGADDYLTKPFEMAELVARLNAIARRATGPRPTEGSQLNVGGLSLDPSSHSACRGEEAVQLNRKLYSLLAHMMRHADKVVTRNMLLEHVWGYSFAPTTNIVESNMSRLRGRLQDLGCDPIETLRGSGYILRSDRCC